MREVVVHVGPWQTAYDLHQLVWSRVRELFGDKTKFLFRAAGHLAKIRADVDSGVGQDVVKLQAGWLYTFDVMLNPARKIGGKKSAMSDSDEVMAFVRKKLAESGFEAIDLKGSFVPGPMFGKPKTRDFRVRVFHALGIVRVLDESNAANLLKLGIGGMRGFGYGMPELAPLQ